MVFKNIQRIKNALPEVIHVAMFYDNGTIFQTTFEQTINIPKLGENLAELLNHVRRIYEVSNLKLEVYKKLIVETDDISVIVLKLGEESNLALFFRKEEDQELKLQSIKRYITRIEELIDMDKSELKLQELIIKEEELKYLQTLLKHKEQEIQDLEKELEENKIDLNQQEIDKISQNIEVIEGECAKLKEQIEFKENEIARIQEEIEKERKKE
ncbi:MAG: hypothetical protein EU539_04000 [Promethearchaeota archaeon]|nr:MAG: hypothetical protein EU539_04000 [Candidatus Lokiarchaeota archaeon]